MSGSTCECVVKFDGAGFWTNTVKGKRATCTGLISQLPSQPHDHEKRIESRWKLSSSALQENENA